MIRTEHHKRNPRFSESLLICAFLLLLSSFAGTTVCGFADPINDILHGLPTPKEVVDGDITSCFRVFDRAGGMIQTEIIPVEDQPFKWARRIEITDTAKYVHWIQLSVKNTKLIRKGDVLFLSFWMQGISNENDTGEGLVSVALQNQWSDRAFQTEFTVDCDRFWRRQYCRAVAKRNYAPGEAALRFQLGFRPQILDIADVRLLNFERRIPYERLPAMPLTYRGMEPDAAWRKRACERIERHRKSELTVRVADARGEPVQGARISLKQTRLAFGLGAAHSAKLYHSRFFEEELPTFQKHFQRLFNKAVLPNSLKWKQYPRLGKKAVMPAYQWLTQNGIPVRGHCIIWPGWNYLPRHVREFEDDPDTLRRLCRERIDTLLADWSGKLAEWDVVNEVYMQDDLLNICGPEVLVEWFTQVRSLDPRARCYYNDANVLANHQPGHADHFFATIKWLLEQDAPIDGIGFQSHIHALVPPEVVYRRIERFAELGPDIKITEFDIQVPNISEELQARYARDYLIAAFSHPRTVGVVTWLGGMPLREITGTRGETRSQCAFFREDWSIKPVGQMWLDLVEKEWKTDAMGNTDPMGRFQTRGFHGRYDLTVSCDSKTKCQSVMLSGNDTLIAIQL